jgi:predicted molibdopterin-dependent oxidoreductase YjgC
MGGNPARSGPNASRIEEILQGMDFLVVQDIFLTETAQLADVVLPASCLLEKDGTVTSTDRRITRVRKILDPPGQARPDGDIIRELGKGMGHELQFSYAEPAEVMDEIARLTPQYGGINYGRLEQGDLQVPCPNVDHAGTPYLFKDGFPIGKGKFFPVEYGPPAELPDKEYPFILSTGSNIFHMRTDTMLGKIQDINAVNGFERVQIHPDDAFSLGVKDNDIVEISSRRGRVNVAVELTDRVPEGVVFMTYHFSQSPANVLTNSAYDPTSKVPEFKFCAVKLAKVVG